MPGDSKKSKKTLKPKYKSNYKLKKSKTTKKIARAIHSFKRTVFMGTYTTTTSSNVATAFSFPMSLLPNASEYKALYDQWKLEGIAFRVIPKTHTFQGATTGNTSTLGYGQVITAIDYDDAAYPSSKDQLLQYQTCKVTRGDEMHTRYFKPKMLQEVFVNSLSTGYSPQATKYTSTDYASIQFYGIKLWIDYPSVASGDSSMAYDIYAVYYFKCKNTK